MGSIVGTRRDLAECLDFAAQGKVKTNIEVRKLEEINTIFEELEKGSVTGRTAWILNKEKFYYLCSILLKYK